MSSATANLDGAGTPSAQPAAQPTSMVRAVGWMAAATWSTQLARWAATITVARLLAPSDFGLIGMANVYLGLAMLLSEFGLGSTVIAMPDLSPQELSQLNLVSVLAGAALFGLSCAAAYPLAIFFRAPALPAVVMAMSTTFVLTSVKIVPAALLQREFRFKLLAIIQAIQSLIYAGATVAAAALGTGYWSLVIGAVLSPAIATVITFRMRPYPFAWPRLRVLKRALVFSGHIISQRVAWYAYSNSDFLMAGRVLGQSALGAYNIAWMVSNLPVQRITDLVTRVVPSYFSNAQKDEAALRGYILKITEGLLLLTLPASLGLSLVARELVLATMGAKWMSAVRPLQILALYVAARSIGTLFAPLLNVRGESRLVMWNNVAAAVYFPAAFYLASRWGGIMGIALMWPVLYPIVAAPLYLRSFRQIQLRWSTYLACLRPALTASLVMTAYLLLLKAFLPASVHLLARLAVEVATGAGIYYLALATLHPGQIRRLHAILRPAN